MTFCKIQRCTSNFTFSSFTETLLCFCHQFPKPRSSDYHLYQHLVSALSNEQFCWKCTEVCKCCNWRSPSLTQQGYFHLPANSHKIPLHIQFERSFKYIPGLYFPYSQYLSKNVRFFCRARNNQMAYCAYPQHVCVCEQERCCLGYEFSLFV